MGINNGYKTIITQEYLLSHNPVYLNIKIPKSSRKLAKGKILDTSNKPIRNACIEINCICKITDKTTLLGYTYTDDDGNYAFTFEASIKYDYVFTIYSSISS